MIGSVQKQILGELAHQRIAPPDDGMSSERLSQLVSRSRIQVVLSLRGLERKGLVVKEPLWRITDEGRRMAA